MLPPNPLLDSTVVGKYLKNSARHSGTTCHPSTQEVRVEDHDFATSLNYKVRSCLQKKKG